VWENHTVRRSRTLRVEISLVRVEITLFRGLITFLAFDITLRMERTLRV
jgi:hypothetical protein